jgi:hypothetical protein
MSEATEPRVEYLITYTFHLDISRSRMIGLPDEIQDTVHVATDGTMEALKRAITTESKKYFGGAGVNLRLNGANQMEDEKRLDNDRVYVLWHMISFISQKTQRLTATTPGLQDNGDYDPTGVVKQ